MKITNWHRAALRLMLLAGLPLQPRRDYQRGRQHRAVDDPRVGGTSHTPLWCIPLPPQMKPPGNCPPRSESSNRIYLVINNYWIFGKAIEYIRQQQYTEPNPQRDLNRGGERNTRHPTDQPYRKSRRVRDESAHTASLQAVHLRHTPLAVEVLRKHSGR